jgi:hypothetical protein
MNIEKMLDAIADLITGIVPWFFSWFGGDPRVKQVQDLVVTSCGFLPTAASVAAMFTASNPIVTSVLGIATAICTAVTAARAQSFMYASVGKPTPSFGTVNGVPIEGSFVGGK